MKQYTSPLKLDAIKIAAKRLNKHFPELKHMKLLDIATHALTGIKSYREAIKQSPDILKKREITNVNHNNSNLAYGEVFGCKPTFRSGDWYFYPEEKIVVFDGEFAPYPMALKRLNSSTALLDFILQVQKKRWPKDVVKKHKISPTYQVDEFISLINELCLYYLDNTIQGVFSPFGEAQEVDWDSAIAIKEQESAEEGA